MVLRPLWKGKEERVIHRMWPLWTLTQVDVGTAAVDAICEAQAAERMATLTARQCQASLKVNECLPTSSIRAFQRHDLLLDVVPEKLDPVKLRLVLPSFTHSKQATYVCVESIFVEISQVLANRMRSVHAVALSLKVGLSPARAPNVVTPNESGSCARLRLG